MTRLKRPRSVVASALIAAFAAFVVAILVSRIRIDRTQTADAAGASANDLAPARATAEPQEKPAAEPESTAAREHANSPFSGARTLDEGWLEQPAGPGTTARRARIARVPETGQVLRFVEHVHVDSTGEPVVVATDVMRADAVIVSVPASERADEVIQRLHGAGFVTEPADRGDAVVCVVVADFSIEAVPAVLAELAQRVPGLIAEPDFIRFSSRTVSNDYDATRLWGLEQIGAPDAWAATTGSSNVVVAVIDSGITLNHPDLVANLWTNPGETAGNGRDDDGNGRIDDIHGWNFGNNNANVTDSDGHGSHVAGTISAAGNNGTGVVGVNWNARIMVLRAGSDTFADSALLNSLRYIVSMRESGVPVVAVNMSLGGTGMSTTFRQELANARDAGILVVAAAGNLSDDTPTANNDVVPVYPASYDVENVIAVASSNQADHLSAFSHYGATTVDLAAPGTAVYSTVTNGQYAWYNGTSMAAPHVSGAVALVAAANPGLGALQIRDRILASVDPVPALTGRVVSGGRLNVRRAVATTLLRPRVVISHGGRPVEIAVIDRAGLDLDLEAVVQRDGEGVASASFAWSTTAGPASVSFSPANGASTVATFPQAGLYRIRVVATAGVLSESDELVVSVGADPGVTTSGLQAWWQFDDTNAATTVDSSGNNRTGTIVSAGRSDTAVFGTSMAFDGSASRVGFDAPAMSRISIAGWVRASGANPATIFPRIVHMQQGLLFGGFDNTGASADDGNAETLKFALDDGVSTQVWHSPPGTLQLGSWYHVAVSYDPSTANPAPVFYIDGNRQVTGTQTSPTSTPSVSAGQGYVGDRGDGTRGWLGQLDELRLYNRVLTDAEVVWMAREVTVRSLLGGTLVAGVGEDPLAIPLTFSTGITKLQAPALRDVSWTAISGATASFSNTSSTAATASFTAPGSSVIRYDAVTDDGVYVVRTLEIEVPSVAVQREGYYTGSTSSDGIWTLLVGPDGSATFFSSATRGSFRSGVTIPEWGVFEFSDRSGAVIAGRIRSDGQVSGTIVDASGASADYAGARVAGGFGSSDPAVDGIYSGWVVDSGARAAAQIESGRLSIAIEESGADRAAAGSMQSSGTFDLSPGAGVSYSGQAGGGRLDADVTLSDATARKLVLFREGVTPARRLVNISVRGFVGTGDAVLIPGFVISGGSLPVLVRGVGPGLEPHGLPAGNLLRQPRIILRGEGLAFENTGWEAGGQSTEIEAANLLTGAFELEPGSADSALLLPLGPGHFTVQVAGADAGTGIALAEVYDARTGPADGTIINISGRGFVGTGDNILIGGFAVTGDAPVLVLVRAAGPALAELGVSGVLTQPRLTVFRESAVLASSGSWGGADSPATISSAATLVGAFDFASASDDAAQLLFLPPGSYTAHVTGADGATGVALLEIYQVEGM